MEIIFFICVIYALISLFTEVRVWRLRYLNWAHYHFWWYRFYVRYPKSNRVAVIAAIVFAVWYKVQSERSVWDKLFDLFN